MSKQALKEKIVNRCNRISVLVEKDAPPIILENEQRALNELLGLFNTMKGCARQNERLGHCSSVGRASVL